MKKKVLTIVVLMFSLLIFVGCDFTISNQDPTTIEVEPNIIEIQNTVTEAYELASKGCVGIYATDGKYASSGSGVIYRYVEETSLYYVVTNSHVVEGMTTFKIYAGGSNYYPANLIGNDISNDIAVLTFSLDIFGGEFYVHDIFNYEDEIITVGQTVLAIGCPLDLTENYNYLSTGVVSKVLKGEVITNAELNPGNSGGGLFNLSGRLIGINTSKKVWAQSTQNGTSSEVPVEGIAYATTLDVVKKCIETIELRQTTITRPVMGVTVTVLNKNLLLNTSTEYEIYLETGLVQFIYVTDVAFNSVAHAAGILAGDVIIKADGIQLEVHDDIRNILYSKEIGDTIDLYIYRYSTKQYLTITVNL